MRFFLCPGQDSNLHTLASTSPSSWRVYQFHHLGNAISLQVIPFLSHSDISKMSLSAEIAISEITEPGHDELTVIQRGIGSSCDQSDFWKAFADGVNAWLS